MANPFLHMWGPMRERFIARHDFYVAQVKRRVLANFSDPEREADIFLNSEYARLASAPGSPDVDLAELASMAQDRAIDYYGLLDDLRDQMRLGAIAGCYHQWDKELREFFQRELRHTCSFEDAEKFAWQPNIGKIFDALKEFGWDCRSEPCFRLIDALRLVINVYKHGNGDSLKQLAAKYPEFVADPLREELPFLKNRPVEHDDLKLSDQQFDDFASALRQFWEVFPTHLMLKPSTK